MLQPKPRNPAKSSKIHKPSNTPREPHKTPNIQAKLPHKIQPTPQPKPKTRPTPIKTLLPPPPQRVKQLRPIGYDFGIGYTSSHFNAKQIPLLTPNVPSLNPSINLTPSTESFAHGFELFTNTNYYLGSGNGGLISGVGMQYLRIKWHTPLQSFTDSFPKSKTDSMLSAYLSLGGFYDVLRMQDKALRIFAGVGLEASILRGGAYDGFEGEEAKRQWGFHLPLMLGFRYIFANNRHGVEAVFKYNPLTTNYDLQKHGVFTDTSTPGHIDIDVDPVIVSTKIHRDFGFGVRYVYEYR